MTVESKPEPKQKAGRQIPVLRIAGTVISLGLLVYLLFREGWQTVSGAVSVVGFPVFLLLLGLTLLSRLAVSFRWFNLLRSANVDISFGQAVRLSFAGLFASNFLPTTIGGDVVRFAGAIRLKVDGAVCAASLVMDRLIGMAGMFTALPIGLVKFFSMPLPSLPVQSSHFLVSGTLYAGFRAKIQEYLKKLVKSVWDAIRLWVSKPGSMLISFVFTWAHMIFLFLTLHIMISRMGESISFWLTAGLWSISYFITQLPISINGYGLQELSLVVIFGHYGGISSQNVLAMALLIRILQMLASLPGAFFVPGLIQPAKSASLEEELKP
ncbi:MAG: flippase-like domain-containing protein [Chloroflexi bacterium]|nr:flippase-like domain-containing protein [Chloroflexota bacterium]